MWACSASEDKNVDPEMQQGLKMICRNIELEARLIDDLLDLTRIARGKLQLHLQTADAHDLLNDAINVVLSDIRSKNIRLSISLDASSHQIKVDAPRLQQVLWNIL